MRDFYSLLKVPRHATAAEIKSAYRRIALVLHPDVNQGDKDKTQQFKAIAEAYRVLSDDGRRHHYDLTLPRDYSSLNRQQRPHQQHHSTRRPHPGQPPTPSNGSGAGFGGFGGPAGRRGGGGSWRGSGPSDGTAGSSYDGIGSSGGTGGTGKAPGEGVRPPPYNAPPPPGQATHDDRLWRAWHYGDDNPKAEREPFVKQTTNFMSGMTTNDNFQYFHREHRRLQEVVGAGERANPLQGRHDIIHRMRARRAARHQNEATAAPVGRAEPGGGGGSCVVS